MYGQDWKGKPAPSRRPAPASFGPSRLPRHASCSSARGSPKRRAPPGGERGAAERAAWTPLDALRIGYIHRVLEHARNKTVAARILGIDRRTLNRILARERALRRPQR